ncbi:MAG TPA: peroxiredoxin family protein [Planctomycetaceae bacterium]|nr:peroxiredoxin family protein [Planctomycetaceae bacterium]
MRRAVVDVVLFVALVGSTLCAATVADEGFRPDHSHYGEAFDCGPRQSAYLLGGTGKIHFPVTSKDPRVEKFIEQGIGQLHGFSYYEAERSFRQAAAIDPACGIAYWGMSLANQRNKTRARQFAAEAGKHKAGLSEREQMYLNALGNDAGYQAIIAKYPADLEAKAFEVWRLAHQLEQGAGHPADKQRALQLAHEILDVDSLHPIHHAVIHLVDDGNNYRAGRDSAAHCGESAPAIGHMWHMPTHIYFPLKRFPEAAWQLEAALRTENARIMRDQILPDQVELYAHNNEWLVRTLMHLGRVHDARQITRQMIALPRHPRLNVLEPPEQEPSADELKEKPKEAHGSSAYYGRDRLLQLLRRYEYWDELIEACRSGEIELTRLPHEQAKVHTALGVAHYCKGEVAAGDSEREALQKLHDEQLALRESAIEEAERTPESQRAGALRAVQKRFARPLASMERGLAEVESYRGIATGFFVGQTRLVWGLTGLLAGEAVALWLLRRRWMPAALVGIAGLGAAGCLCYGHWALVNIADESTNVDFAFVTRKQLEAGDPAAALQSARQYARERTNQVRPQANLVEMLHAAGQTEEARSAFQKLRVMAGTADLDAPPFARLAPIAREFGFPTDWRLPQEINQQLAGRPSLESIGPRGCRPWRVHDWTLSDAQGHQQSLSSYRGKPVVLVFSLGGSCLHCQQQLDALVKEKSRFAEAGWVLLAISCDDRAALQKTLASYKPGPFPFPLLADPDLAVFRLYHAYDDFERIALHGTFLIDPEGFVRWIDVGSEPFMDVPFLIAEFTRLLSRPVQTAADAALETTAKPD